MQEKRKIEKFQKIKENALEDTQMLPQDGNSSSSSSKPKKVAMTIIREIMVESLHLLLGLMMKKSGRRNVRKLKKLK